MQRTSLRKKGTAATRVGTSIAGEDAPQTAKEGGEIITAQTPSSVPEDSQKAGTGRMPLTSDGSGSQVEGPKFEKGQTSASRDSAESDRPTRRRPASGSEDRLSTLLREDAEEFGEFFHEGKAGASPKVRSFEEDALLNRPPPDYEQSQENWLDLHDGTREKLWRLYRMDNPSTLEDDEESVRMEEAMARARKERSDKKARQDLEREHAVKRVDLQTQLDEAARQLWGDERTRQGAEERVADAEAQIKELRAEAAAASSHQRETYDRYQKLLQEWRSEERKSKQKFSGTSLQDLVLEPLRLPDLPPSVRLFEKRAEPQRSAAPPPDNAEAARPVPAWVGSPSRRPTPEAGQICRPLQSTREVEISLHKGTGGGTIGAASPESHRGAGPNASERPVLDDQFPGPGGHQSRHAQRSVGKNGQLLPGTASGGLGRPPKFGSCDHQESSRGPDRREAST